MSDITHALKALAPEAEWAINADDYKQLVWINGNGFEKPTIEQINAKIAELNIQEPWDNLRRNRNKLLIDTDWTQTPDVPENIRTAYTTYRQALRDLPANTEDPANPTWPTKPS